MEEKITRISNIKATAWTTIILFSLVGYYIFSNYFISGLMALDNPMFAGDEEMPGEFSASRDKVVVASAIIVIYMLLTIYGATGLLRRRLKGLIVFQASTIALIIGIIGFMAYFAVVNEPYMIEVYDRSEKIKTYIGFIRIIETTSFATILLVIVWILTRANLMLFRKEYRKEFR